MRVSLVSVSRPLIGDGDPRRLVELAVKTSAGKVKGKGFKHYLTVMRTDDELNRWLIEASEKFPSVLEHVVFTFMIEGCSRVCSHQLVRHRIASYTQESLRYSVLSNLNEIADDAMFTLECVNSIDDDVRKKCFGEVVKRMRKYFVFPDNMEDLGTFIGMLSETLMEYVNLIKWFDVRPEDARYVLPMATKTRIMMTVNLRELLHIGCMRLSKYAQAEIKEVVAKMLDEVEEKLSIPVWEMKKRFCGDGV